MTWFSPTAIVTVSTTVLIVTTNIPDSTTTTLPLPSADVQPSFPIRGAFYYPWFPEAWNQGGVTHAADPPASPEATNSTFVTFLIEPTREIAAMRSSGKRAISAGIVGLYTCPNQERLDNKRRV